MLNGPLLQQLRMQQQSRRRRIEARWCDAPSFDDDDNDDNNGDDYVVLSPSMTPSFKELLKIASTTLPASFPAQHSRGVMEECGVDEYQKIFWHDESEDQVMGEGMCVYVN